MSNMKVYLLYYDTENDGSREEWSVFYTPCEVFLSEEKRQERIDFIENETNFEGEFHTEDLEVMDASKIKKWDRM